MKLEKKDILVENIGQTVFEDTFKVGDTGLIFSILRDKLYSNPVRAICREITCNARDANREAGKADEPIVVVLPNAFDSHLKIRDSGLGISPERMSEIFIQYGKSTKRNDNVQTGAFGIGAKTPFAYSDQFHIITTSASDGKNVKRTYIAYIDESEAGKIRLVSEIPTDEPTGTEISIKVEQKDFNTFKAEIKYVCNYWDVKPIIKGSDLSWNIEELFFKQKLWNIAKIQQNQNTYYYYDYDVLAIIDGIQYKINVSNLNKSEKQFKNINFNKRYRLYFNTGELTLSANREELQYDERTINAIKERFLLIDSELSDILSKEIESKETYVEAVNFVISYNQTMGLNIKAVWKGQLVVGPMVHFSLNNVQNKTGFEINIDAAAYRHRNVNASYRKVREANVLCTFVINDLGTKISRQRIETLLLQDKQQAIYVLSIDDDLQFEELKTKDERVKFICDKFKLYTDLDLTYLNYKYMSDILIDKVSVKKAKNDRSNISVFVLDCSYSAPIKRHNYWRPVSSEELDKSNKDIKVSLDRVKNEIKSDDYYCSVNKLFKIAEFTNKKIYVLRENDIPNVNNLISIKEAIDETIKNKFNKSFDEIISILNTDTIFDVFNFIKPNFYNRYIKNLNKDSLFLKLLNESVNINNIKSKLQIDLDYIILASRKKAPITTIPDTINLKYKMLKYLNISGYSLSQQEINDIIEYINTVDAAGELEQIELKAV